MTLHGALSDPLIRSVMAADNVDPGELELMLQRIADTIPPAQHQLTADQLAAFGNRRRRLPLA
jgi:hypothetical protein